MARRVPTGRPGSTCCPRTLDGPARGVAAADRRLADARLHRAGPARCDEPRARPPSSRSGSPTRSPSTSTSPCSTGTATARSGCCRPTRTGGRCCSSGCTRRTSPSSGTSRRARSSPASMPGCTVPAPPQLRPLTVFVERWTDDLAAAAAQRADPAPARRAGGLARRATSCDDEASTGTLIHTDLHYENVLAADREPWLAIDPKPVSGDPHYELAPMLWNRFDELDGRRPQRRPTPVPHPGRRRRARRGPGPRLGRRTEVHNACWRLQDDPEARTAHADRGVPDDVHRHREGRPGLT